MRAYLDLLVPVGVELDTTCCWRTPV